MHTNQEILYFISCFTISPGRRNTVRRNIVGRLFPTQNPLHSIVLGWHSKKIFLDMIFFLGG